MDLGSSPERSQGDAKEREAVSVADTVGIYLEEVSAHLLLTAEDEVRLARSMESGRRAAHKLDTGEELTPTDRAKLYRLIHEGDEAKMTFIRANLRLVISIAAGTTVVASTSSISSRRATSG